MSDAKFPPDPRLPSIPKLSPGRSHELSDTAPPSEEDPIALMIELKAAFANAGQLHALDHSAFARAAGYASERAQGEYRDRARERSAWAFGRLGKVEAKLGMAAE